jgi:hypothetical protein
LFQLVDVVQRFLQSVKLLVGVLQLGLQVSDAVGLHEICLQRFLEPALDLVKLSLEGGERLAE